MQFKLFPFILVLVTFFSCTTVSGNLDKSNSIYFQINEGTDPVLIDLLQFIESQKFTSARNLIESYEQKESADFIYLSAWNSYKLKQYATAVGLFQKLTTIEKNNRGYWGIAFVHDSLAYYKAAADQAMAGLYFTDAAASIPDGELQLIAGRNYYMLEEWDLYDEFIKLALDSGYGDENDRSKYAQWLLDERRNQEAELYQ